MAVMVVDRIIAPVYDTNCWIIAPSLGSECLIVDPGIDTPDLLPPILAMVAARRLKPVAVLITHGHIDHTFSLIPLSQVDGVATTYIHRADRNLLSDPMKGHGPQGLALLDQLAPGKKWKEPDRVEELVDGQRIEIAGMSVEAIHSPGHTEGSLMYRISNDLLISGDVLFKGAIGRTDLPTGSPKKMDATLTNKVLTLPDNLRVLPGHGDETEIGIEKVTNPFLLSLNPGERK
jgi:glyoxylase-like metal-dependent hydrolase (beta-lactamase superfamily II)